MISSEQLIAVVLTAKRKFTKKTKTNPNKNKLDLVEKEVQKTEVKP